MKDYIFPYVSWKANTKMWSFLLTEMIVGIIVILHLKALMISHVEHQRLMFIDFVSLGTFMYIWFDHIMSLFVRNFEKAAKERKYKDALSKYQNIISKVLKKELGKELKMDPISLASAALDSSAKLKEQTKKNTGNPLRAALDGDMATLNDELGKLNNPDADLF